MLVSFSQSENAPSPIVVTVLGIMIVVSFLLQLWKALPSIVVSPSGRLIVVRLKQFKNAQSPIVLMLSGSETFSILLQF